ncbi:site-specific recombinase XerD [Dysgonomonas alginatilytica]|uniref:Site-specific recombinase XerD n=1 Tax=Dysgonomonas alginatilytica TaxID=1605892 RepID=A0A2V3PJI6_9BACT|nr:site-specific integrase [Dysgonomonas alginatilytica]PXV58453.1 site-specific recombinase XerD [Dysgonomonas alginatilytica]
MKTELNILFYLKKNQSKTNGLCPVMGRIRIGKSVAQFSLKIDADSELWDIKAGRMTGKSNAALEVNREINRINLLLHARYKELKEVQPEVCATDVKNAMQGIASTQDTVMVHFQKMVEDASLRLGIDLKESSLAEYTYSYRWLKTYLRKKLNLSDIPFKALTYSFIEEYYRYLRVEKKFKISTTVGYVVFFRKVVRNAVNQGILFRDPFGGFVPEERVREHKTLTRKELDKIMSFEIDPNLKRSVSRDLFVFACFTGMAYVDIKHLTYDKITQDENGNQWIIAKRIKSGIKYQVRLMDIPLAIIEKYRGTASEGKVFPVPQMKTVHRSLNYIASRCNIHKMIGFHQGRHTFASLVTLSEGVPIETVSLMLGHRHIKTTQGYAELSLDKIAKDTRQLSKRIAGQFKLIDYYSIKKG